MSHAWRSTGGARELRPQLLTKYVANFLAAVAVFALAVLLARAVSAAEETAWTVGQVQGQVHVRNGNGAWKTLEKGDRLGASTEIVSGENSSAVLVRGGSAITVARETRVELPMDDHAEQTSLSGILPEPASISDSQKGRNALRTENVVQTFGTMLYKVKPLNGREFKVHTPHLVATIKGTVFSVSVNDAGAAVHVSEGVVEVTAAAGNDRAMVPAGHTVSFSTKSGKGLEMRSRGKARAPAVQPAQLNADHQGQSDRNRDTVIFREHEREDAKEHERDGAKELAKIEDGEAGGPEETKLGEGKGVDLGNSGESAKGVDLGDIGESAKGFDLGNSGESSKGVDLGDSGESAKGADLGDSGESANGKKGLVVSGVSGKVSSPELGRQNQERRNRQ